MKINKLFAITFTSLVFLYLQPTYAWLAQCKIAGDSKNPLIVCGANAAGGYITVKNTSPITAPKTIHVYPGLTPDIELKPNALSRLIYFGNGLQIECRGCTAQNAKVTIVTQCLIPPTEKELSQSTCKAG